MADMNLLNQVLAETLTCACEALEEGISDEEGAVCGCPCRVFISAGPPVWDLEACCGDGQLAVYVKDIYPFSTFPNRGGQAEICSPTLAATISVQLLRCWPANLNDDGSAPTHMEINAASLDIYRDLFLLTWGLVCCMKQIARKRKYVLNGGRILAPNGGCVGAEVDFVIELIDV